MLAFEVSIEFVFLVMLLAAIVALGIHTGALRSHEDINGPLQFDRVLHQFHWDRGFSSRDARRRDYLARVRAQQAMMQNFQRQDPVRRGDHAWFAEGYDPHQAQHAPWNHQSPWYATGDFSRDLVADFEGPYYVPRHDCVREMVHEAGLRQRNYQMPSARTMSSNSGAGQGVERGNLSTLASRSTEEAVERQDRDDLHGLDADGPAAKRSPEAENFPSPSKRCSASV